MSRPREGFGGGGSAGPEGAAELAERLVVVGVSVPGCLERCLGVGLGAGWCRSGAVDRGGEVDRGGHADLGGGAEAVLRRVRPERAGAVALLRGLRSRPGIEGCAAVSTCQRFEVYALERRGFDARAELLRVGAFAGVGAVSRRGPEALRGLIATALGLGSHIPGETDAADQIAAAGRVAAEAGTIGPGLSELFDYALKTAGQIRRTTAWGGFGVGFVRAALTELGGAVPHRADSVVIGGSGTARAIVSMRASGAMGLNAGPMGRTVFVFRGAARRDLHRFVRRLDGGVEGVSVDGYDDPRVLGEIGRAGAVYLAGDAAAPVLRGRDLLGLRDFVSEPLTVIDFNAHGSTEGLGAVGGVGVIDAGRLNEAAARFGRRMTGAPGFERALAEVVRRLDGPISTGPGSEPRGEGPRWAEGGRNRLVGTGAGRLVTGSARGPE